MPEAKQTSKAAMIFSTIWVIAMAILAPALEWRITVDEIIKVGLAVNVIWSPIYLSIWLDKFVGKHADKSASLPTRSVE